MKQIYLLFCLLGLLSFPITSCSENPTEYEWEWDKEDDAKDPNGDIVALGWTAQTQFGKLPDYIRVYKSPAQLESKNAIAYIAVADMKKGTFSVLGEKSGYKTPTQFYEQEPLPVIMNAGYFWDGASLSLICRGGQMICPNTQTASKDWVTIYNPTRGAFSLLVDGTYKASWTYTTQNNVTYSYPQPSYNKYTEVPQPTPSATFPTGGSELKAQTAIGGGPVLIKDGVIKDTFVAELLDISADSAQPRSAIGITKGMKMIFFVCEGRNMTQGVAGYTTAQVASILKSLGCVEALNLDGGGSSCMLINGKETIKGSDGKQRTVVTAVGIK